MPRPLLILDPVHGGDVTDFYDIENGVRVSLPDEVLADPARRRYLSDEEHAAWKRGERDDEPRYVISHLGRQVSTGRPGGRCVLDPMLREKDVVLDVARTLSREMEPSCVVKLTRERDGFVGMEHRRRYVDRLIGRFGRPALLVSLEAHAADDSAKNGFFVRHRPGEDAALASCLHWELSSHLEELGMSGAPSVGGIREQVTPILEATDVPAVSVQLGFLSSPEDARRLMSRPLRNELAHRLAAGLHRHLERGPREVEATGGADGSEPADAAETEGATVAMAG